MTKRELLDAIQHLPDDAPVFARIGKTNHKITEVIRDLGYKYVASLRVDPVPATAKRNTQSNQ